MGGMTAVERFLQDYLANQHDDDYVKSLLATKIPRLVHNAVELPEELCVLAQSYNTMDDLNVAMQHFDSVLQHAHSLRASTADVKDGIMAEEQQFKLQRLKQFLVPNLSKMETALRQTEEELSRTNRLVDKLPL